MYCLTLRQSLKGPTLVRPGLMMPSPALKSFMFAPSTAYLKYPAIYGEIVIWILIY